MNKYAHLAPPKAISAPPQVTRKDKEQRKKQIKEGRTRGGVNRKRG